MPANSNDAPSSVVPAIALPAPLIEQVMNYLATKPFIEVNQLLSRLVAEINRQAPQPGQEQPNLGTMPVPPGAVQ